MTTFLNDGEQLDALFAPKPAPNCKDTLMVNAEVRLSWKERLLLLFRPLLITVRVDCENEVGKTQAVTLAWAARWRWPWQRRGEESGRPKGPAMPYA